MSRIRELGAAPIVLLVIVLPTMSTAGLLIFQMSVEQATAYADLVVLGRVVESPEFGTADGKAGVVRRHRVKVEQYLKGTGGTEVAVVEGSSDSAPQLPEVGSDVVLFLRRWGDGWVMASGSHGVIPVTTAKDGTRSVLFYIATPTLMPPDELAAFRKYNPDAVKASKPVAGRIRVEDLRSLFDQIGAPLSAGPKLN